MRGKYTDKDLAALNALGPLALTLVEINGYAAQTLSAIGLGFPMSAFQPVVITNSMLKRDPRTGGPARANAKAAGFNQGFTFTNN